MKNKEITLDYDYENDNLFIFLKNNKYKYTEFLNDSVSIDFDKDENPIGFEVADASTQFKTQKLYLNNIISGEIKVIITEKNVNLSMTLYVEVRNKSIHLNSIDVVEDNYLNIPNTEVSVAIA
ncbi:DUF2283 domain-containing protein [Methanobrevibacter filiformis]|uniref:DUF2283 domain-containing protein n=1 Tax=Methanobrevibacter filiformis TaxID=55758 RepID=A0A166ELA6_9EURY|nr:DUF2283 domain-containing protein [Methanobrevibacter filiformis]KZX16782.1 hypothetical protein MBFIL_04730 [Methanobrevibacter filiformis]